MKTLVVYFANWCKPCQRTKLVLDNIKNTEILYVDVDKEDRNGISTLPTIIIHDNDAEIERIEGELYESDLEYLSTKYGIR